MTSTSGVVPRTGKIIKNGLKSATKWYIKLYI